MCSFFKNLLCKITRYKLVDTWNNRIYPQEDWNKIFKLSPKEYEDSQRIFKQDGNISYEFYPCGGISWGVRIHKLKTGEIIDITDISVW